MHESAAAAAAADRGVMCSRRIQDRNWEILEVSRARVDQFRRTVPLITDLKNPAMRQRHWDQVQVVTLINLLIRCDLDCV